MNPNKVKFFAEIKERYGIDVPENEQTAFLTTAATCLHDFRMAHLLHPDKEMVTTSCLHYLGDDAQIWWANKHNKKERTMPYGICNGD